MYIVSVFRFNVQCKDDELLTEEWKSVNSALKNAICKYGSKKAAAKFMGFQRGNSS